MPAAISDEVKEQIREMSERHVPQSAIAEQLGLCRSTVRTVQRTFGLETKPEWLTAAKREEIRSMTLAGEPQERNAGSLGISTDTLRRTQSELGVVPVGRKAVKNKRWHLTKREKERIRRLTRAGMRQSEIARKLHIGADTISVWQRRLGLPTVPPLPETEILRLLRQGKGQNRIHRILRVSQPKVHAVMVANGIHRSDQQTVKGDIEGFIEAIKNREGHIRALRKRFGLGYEQAHKLAHRVLRTKRFRPGAVKSVLSSDWPQKHHRKKGSKLST